MELKKNNVNLKFTIFKNLEENATFKNELTLYVIFSFVALDRPVIHQMTNDISMPEGKGFKIEVIFSGSPTPEVAWFRGQDRVVPSSVFKVNVAHNELNL